MFVDEAPTDPETSRRRHCYDKLLPSMIGDVMVSAESHKSNKLLSVQLTSR